MFKYKRNMLPLSFNNFFTVHRENHNYNTRNKDDFRIPMQKISTISTHGPKIWNELPRNVIHAKTLNQFRSLLKSELLRIWLFFPCAEWWYKLLDTMIMLIMPKFYFVTIIITIMFQIHHSKLQCMFHACVTHGILGVWCVNGVWV